MQYIEAPCHEPTKHFTIFLAGGITHCPNWQSELVGNLSYLDISILNPRRAHYPKGSDVVFEQIHWEYTRMREAHVIVFWFSRGSINPITLFELGGTLERETPLIIGVDPEYTRKKDVYYQVALRQPQLIIYSKLDTIVDKIESIYTRK